MLTGSDWTATDAGVSWTARSDNSAWHTTEVPADWSARNPDEGGSVAQSQSQASKQYVRALVTAIVAGAPYNPTADTVAFAFTEPGTSALGAQWSTGSWANTESSGSGGYIAQCLVGPGGAVQLAPGSYQVWVQVTDSPETPVIPAYLLTISC